MLKPSIGSGWIRWFIVLAAFNAVPALATEPAPLTLDDALRLFRQRGFDLIIADASVASAEADVTSARAIANPSFSLSRGSSSTYDPSLCSGCSSTSISEGVTDQGAASDFITGKRRLRIAIARALARVAGHSRADVERTLEFTVKQQLLDAELAKQSLINAREAQQLSSETLHLVEVRYHAGAVSEADVARSEVQKLEADQAVDVAVQSLASAMSALGYLLGYAESPPLIDVANDLTRPASRVAEISREEMVREAIDRRPDLAASMVQVERARSSVELARRQRLPDFSPSLSYSQEGRGQSAIQPPTVTLGVSATLPLFYRYRGEIAHAEADLHTQEATRRKIEAQVLSDVSVAYAALVSARDRITRMESRLLERSGRARDLVRLQYQKGAASLFEFLDAQRTYLAVQTEYLQTLNDYWTAIFQLEEATAMEISR
jgi:outer membrane protein, heavy metal efflux system